MSIARAFAAVENFDEDAREWLQAGLRTWLTCNGDVSLQRCLRLPSRSSGVRREVRDYWLQQAFLVIEGDGGAEKWRTFEAELRSFEGWKFAAWRKLDQPPAYATQLERCLFLALLQGDIPGTRKQLRAIVPCAGNESRKQFPEPADIVPSSPENSDSP